jgi:hypothetical protein
MLKLNAKTSVMEFKYAMARVNLLKSVKLSFLNFKTINLPVETLCRLNAVMEVLTPLEKKLKW